MDMKDYILNIKIKIKNRLHNKANKSKQNPKIYYRKDFINPRGLILCLFSSYNEKGLINPYVEFYIEKLKKNNVDIVFISTSPVLILEEIEKIKGNIISFIHRENIGYDFGSWKEGLRLFDYKSYPILILTNDSIYGPLYDLKNVFDKMQSIDSDFLGITDSFEINYHLMSYFLMFKETVTKSKIFSSFWENVLFLPNELKSKIILDYEIGLSQLLINHGFKAKAYCDYKSIKNNRIDGNLNPTLFFWKELFIDLKNPFIKRELFKDYIKSDNEQVLKIISEITKFNIELIKQDQGL